MVKIRVIFIKQFAFRRKGRHKQVFFSDQKISWLTYSYEIKWWSLSWNASWSKIQIKRIHNTQTSVAHLRYKSIIDKVSLKLHKASSKTFWPWTSFTPQVMKMLILLANSHCPFIIRKVISRVPNQYPKWLFSYSNHPLSIKTYWLLLIRSYSKIVPTPLPVCTMQGTFGIHDKVHSK